MLLCREWAVGAREMVKSEPPPPAPNTHLCLCTETTVLHAGGKELQGTLCELEALLHHAGQLPDALGLLAHHVHGVGGADDHLRLDGGIADLHASVPCITQLAVEQLIDLGGEGGGGLWVG